MRDKIRDIVVQAVAGTKDLTEAIDELHDLLDDRQSEQLSCNTCKFYPVDYDSFCATCKNFEKHVKAT